MSARRTLRHWWSRLAAPPPTASSLERKVFEHSADAVLVIDVEQDRIVDANARAAVFLEYDRDELINTQVSTIHPRDLARLREFSKQVGREGTGWTDELECVTRTGRVIPAEISASVIDDGSRRYLIAIVREAGKRSDVSQQPKISIDDLDADVEKRAVSLRVVNSALRNEVRKRRRVVTALRTSQKRLKTIIEEMPVMMLALDSKDRIIMWNTECERVTGWSKDEVSGTGFSELMFTDPAYREDVMTEWPRGHDFLDWELEVTCRDDAIKTIAWSDISRRVHVPGWSSWCIGVDVSERKDLERRYLHSQKMEAIGTLAGGIAHDFNNLLMGITGCCEMALKARHDSETAGAWIGEAIRACERGAALGRQLLAFSSRSQIEPVPIVVADQLQASRRILETVIREDISLHVSTGDNRSKIELDPGQFEQILLNLVSNAQDAMPTGGDLEIWIEDLTVGPNCVGLPEGSYIRLSVRDTGQGMDEDTKSRAFEPFFTTKAPGSGTGLGLATVYGIVQSSGGFVELETELGQGTTVRVCFPREEQQPQTEPKPLDRRVPDKGGGTILLADDDRLIRRALGHYLRAAGYDVIEGDDGATLLQNLKMRSADQKPDLLLTDVVMPGMAGEQLAQRVRDRYPDIRVLFMTGHSHRDLTDLIEISGEPILYKPFSRETLLSRLEALLQGRWATSDI